MQTDIDPRDLIGHKAVDRNGDKIGTVDEVYLDDATGEPEWAAVRTGIFGRDAFVPLATSEFVSEELRVPYDKSQVKDSPDFGAGQHLSPAQELQLYRYYGLDVPSESGSRANGQAAPSDASDASDTAATPAAAAAVGGSAAHTAPAAAGDATARTQAAAVPDTASSGTASSGTAGSDTAATDTARSAERTDGLTGEHTSASAPEQGLAAGAAGGAAGAAAGYAAASSKPAEHSSPAGGRTSAFFTGSAGTTTPEPSTTAQTPTPVKEEETRAVPHLTDRDSTAAAGTAKPAGAAGTGAPEQIEVVCREERLDITTEWHELGRARLRKYVTTENVERRVPVVRERVRIERVRLSDDERAQISDQEIEEATQEVPVHEERVVVRKHVVPVERIRLITERVTEEEVVRDQLRREQVEVHDAGQGSQAGQSGQSERSGQGQAAQGGRNGAAPSAGTSTTPYSPGARYPGRPAYGH
ncbi:PRC and DUF2382 domain-containing protein [Phaeacidiphilus oryzae]|uniref:PRC and DUF2382 domain-containing protein n=1 Tax=Phaeacidiphilus oryzae TaxID=348818 RepID=UPI000AB4780B|nr:PRC and DUF2382 domain-containing protein [Phaeacidiphilus oryzae]